jgi:hypothetical protein
VSLPDSESTRPAGILVRTPTTNIYTSLLGVAVGALALGSLFLFLELLSYDWIWNTPWLQKP